MDFRLSRRLLHIASTVGCLISTGSATADIIHVPKDYPTIQGAINVASKGDEIIVAPGTYNEQINFLGQAIYLHSSGGPEVTSIVGDGTDGCINKDDIVTFASGEGPDTILDGFIISGGLNGIYNFNGSAPTVRNCSFVDNLRGIYNIEATMVVSNSVFRDTSSGGGCGDGGGLSNHRGDVIMTDCVFIENGGYHGSAMSSTGLGSNVLIERCYFTENVASGRAISVRETDTTIRHSVFIANNGGIKSVFGSLSVSNCFFVQNARSGTAYGGGIYISSSYPSSISQCTFMGNEAANGGAVFSYSTPNNGPTIDNSVFWLNFPNPIAGDHHEVNFSDIQGGWNGDGEGNINAYPMFVDMEGGNLRLLEGSPCIDTGSNDYVPKDLIVDLDGNERIVDGDEDGTATVDMGTYEYQGYPVCKDMDGDGAVGPFDLAVVLGNWGFNPGHPADLDGDGIVGPFDLALLLGAWGPCE